MNNKEAPAQNFASALGRVVANTRIDRVAPLAYLQASMAQVAAQALIDLLRNQNVISQEQIQRALNDAYNKRASELAGNHGATAAPPPSAAKN